MCFKQLAEMREQGIQPNLITSNAAISASGTSMDQWQTASKQLAEMKEQGIQPNFITYSSAIMPVRTPAINNKIR